MTAFQILQMATQREAEQLAQARSDYAEQIKAANLKSMGEMEGGFASSQTAKMESEYSQASKDQKENAKLKLDLLKQQQEAERKAQADAAKARTVGMITGPLSAAAGIINPALGAGVGAIGNIVSQSVGGQGAPVDYNALYQGIQGLKKETPFKEKFNAFQKKKLLNPTYGQEFLPGESGYQMPQSTFDIWGR